MRCQCAVRLTGYCTQPKRYAALELHPFLTLFRSDEVAKGVHTTQTLPAWEALAVPYALYQDGPSNQNTWLPT